MCVNSLLHVLYFYVYIHIMYIYKGSWELFCNDLWGECWRRNPDLVLAMQGLRDIPGQRSSLCPRKRVHNLSHPLVGQTGIKAVMMGRTTAWPGLLSSCLLFQPKTPVRTPRMDLGHCIYLLLFLIWPFALHCHLFVQSAIEESGWS